MSTGKEEWNNSIWYTSHFIKTFLNNYKLKPPELKTERRTKKKIYTKNIVFFMSLHYKVVPLYNCEREREEMEWRSGHKDVLSFTSMVTGVHQRRVRRLIQGSLLKRVELLWIHCLLLCDYHHSSPSAFHISQVFINLGVHYNITLLICHWKVKTRTDFCNAC